MSRPPGRRNRDYEERRETMARAALHALLDANGGPAAGRELARAAGASASVMQHYFGDRDGMVLAALAVARADGEVYLAAARDPGKLGLDDGVRAWLASLHQGWRYGLGRLQAAGLVHGLSHPTFGPAYVQELLEPTLQAVEARLAVHQSRGELRADADLRLATLQLVSPALLALLHQGELGGARCRPLDLDAFLRAHADAWLRAWSA